MEDRWAMPSQQNCIMATVRRCGRSPVLFGQFPGGSRNQSNGL